MRGWPILLVALTGCTLYGGDDEPSPDELPPCETTQRAYRIDAIDVPGYAAEAEDLGWDLDGDGGVDNQGGSLIGGLDSALDVDLQGAVDDALNQDLVQIGVVIDECAEPDYALVSLDRGLRLDRETSPPTLLVEEVTTAPAVARDGLPAAALHGTTQFPVGQLIHPFADRWIDADELVAVIDDVSDDSVSGRLAAALDHDQAFDIVARGFQAKIVEREAELGPCTPASCDSVLQTLYDVFDFNGDRIVTLAEIKENTLFLSLLAADLDLDDDGTADHLSIGVGFRASRVELR